MRGRVRGYDYMAPLRLSRKKKKQMRKDWNAQMCYSKMFWYFLWRREV